MTLEQMNKKYASQFIDRAVKLVNKKGFLTVSMLQRELGIEYAIAALLYDMVDEELETKISQSDKERRFL